MKITYRRLDNPLPVSFEEFAYRHGLEMVVTERHHRLFARENPPRYYAQLEGAEVKDGVMLVGVTGDADTEQRAIEDYARKIAGKVLVISAYSPLRREIQCPNEWSEK